ncbi:MAG: signal peptidase I [Clostridia bacterium]|nr:signal peptidase I [Clostridia bacterium]
MSKEKKPAKKIIKIVFNVIIALFTVFALFVTVIALSANNSEDGIPSVFGKTLQTIESPSMEPALMTGDLIVGSKLDESEKTGLAIGDIVTFRGWDITGDGSPDLITHRIVEIVTAENGEVSYWTQGDNNPGRDTSPVASRNVLVKYNGTRFAGLGRFLGFLRTPNGFLLVIVLPLVAFFIYELVMFIVKYKRVKNEGKREISAAEEEAIKQKAIEEYLKSRNGNGEDK